MTETSHEASLYQRADADQTNRRPPLPGQGIELGRFRLKPGTEESRMRAAYDRMVARHLSQLPGWRGQQLIRLQDGSFVDLALADSQARAMAICEAWHGNPDCQAFLALIDPISMEFGRAI